MLSDRQILECIKSGSIKITPFNIDSLGSNSYDVHLGSTLATYVDAELDAKVHHKLNNFEIPKEGYVLQPGKLYLGVTKEYTETHKHVPLLEAKSSLARLGVFCHLVAGVGDVGFCNYWTLEIFCLQPIRIYEGMPVAQLLYLETGEVETKYGEKTTSKYNEVSDKPKESMMWKNFVNKN